MNLVAEKRHFLSTHSQMKEGSVYNLIDKLDPKDLKYLSSDNIQVDVCDKAKEVLDHAINLASTWKKEGKGT